MRIECSIGDITASVEDDNTYTPECVADMLGRTASAVIAIFAKIPDQADSGADD